MPNHQSMNYNWTGPWSNTPRKDDEHTPLQQARSTEYECSSLEDAVVRMQSEMVGHPLFSVLFSGADDGQSSLFIIPTEVIIDLKKEAQGVAFLAMLRAMLVSGFAQTFTEGEFDSDIRDIDAKLLRIARTIMAR